MSPLLEVEDLVVRYPIPRGIVGTVTRRPRRPCAPSTACPSRLAAGEILALVGESGCGKTTTAQALMRLQDATAARSASTGRDITGLGERALRPLRRRIQIIYQDPYESLDPRLARARTVEEPLADPPASRGSKARATRARARGARARRS